MEKNNSSKGKEKESERIISIPKGKRQFDAALFGATIQKGFSKLHKDEKTSDIILLVGEEKIPTHRMVICAWSDTFRGMLETGSWQESNEKELKINIEEEDYAVFKLLIEYMYTGNADFVDDDNVIPLISLTNYYGIHSLKEVCGKLLGEQINDGNIQFLLDLVDKYDCKELEKKCGEYLASNFEDMWADDQTKILSLRPDTWAAMLQSDDLTISSEQLLFEILQEYAKQFDNTKEGGETRASVLDKLLPHVRYNFISTKYLTEKVESDETLMSHPLLQRILFENYRYKAYAKSQPKLFTTRMRTASQRFDENHKAPGFTITEDGTKATSSGGGWQSIRVECPFSESYVYCEFKCESVVNVMVGVVVGDSVPLTGYIGQYTNGYCVHNSDGSFFYNGSSVSKGLTYATGDVIGVSYVPALGLSFYKNGSKIFSHPLSTTSAQTDIYAAFSATTGSSVSVVPRPCLPDDLVEHARGKQRKRKETDTKAVAPAATPTFSFGTTTLFGTPFGAATSSGFSF